MSYHQTDTTETALSQENKRNIKSFFSRRFVLVFVLFILLTGGLIGYKTYKQLVVQKPATVNKTISKQILVRRSKIPDVITKATTAKVIDVKTGKVIQAASIFLLNDKTIYLVLDLDNAKSGTFIDYIRYLNGRYVDHGNVKITKDATNNITFNWTNVKQLGSVGDGKWKIATYTNGILEKRISYLVKKNSISYVFPNESVSLTDSEYNLHRTVVLLSKTQ